MGWRPAGSSDTRQSPTIENEIDIDPRGLETVGRRNAVRFIGTVVRLQIQESSLKVGSQPRRYDPAPIRSVPALSLDSAGVIGLLKNEETIVDVHHQNHPASKNRGGENGISLGFTTHYVSMRQRFGPHLRDGIAGENVLIAVDRPISAEDLAAGVGIEGTGGRRLELHPVIVAAPCVEFARYVLKFPAGNRPDATVTEALRFLDAGMRGFYVTYAGEPSVVEVGARVFVN
jgi:hypothetical protein